MLPFPHVDACLAEIAYAFDTLKVDGVGCMTSYGDKWLGYAEFEPVWEELNRRKATVYTHPTAANCCVNLVRGIDAAYLEFGIDTTRSIFSLVFSGSSQKNKDINWIFSHGGGALTAFAERFLVQAISRPPYAGKVTRATVEGELNRFYYDTAQVANPVTLSAMAQADADLADRVRHRFSLSHRGRAHQGRDRVFQGRRSPGHRPGERTPPDAAAEDGLTGVGRNTASLIALYALSAAPGSPPTRPPPPPPSPNRRARRTPHRAARRAAWRRPWQCRR